MYSQQHSVSLTTLNSTQSPLLRLPGELRNKIYEFASTGNIILVRTGFYDEVWCAVCGHCEQGLQNEDRVTFAPSTYLFNLRQVCRQTRAETNDLDICTGNIFSFRDLAAYHRFADEVITRKQREAIKVIALHNIKNFTRKLDKQPTTACRDAFPNLEKIVIRFQRPEAVVRLENVDAGATSSRLLDIVVEFGRGAMLNDKATKSSGLEFLLVERDDIRTDQNIEIRNKGCRAVIENFPVMRRIRFPEMNQA